MKRDTYRISSGYEADLQHGHGVAAASLDARMQGNALSPEFCDLIYHLDPEAANDDYYVTSADFIELHARVKRELLRGLAWWSGSVLLVTTGLAIAYS